MATRTAIVAAVLLILGAGRASADWAHVVQACGDAAKQPPSSSGSAPASKKTVTIADANSSDTGTTLLTKWDKRYPWEDCILKFIGVDPVAPVVGNLGTGGGLAVGARAEQEINSGRLQSLLAGRGLIAPFSGSYLAELHWDAMMPSFGHFEDQIFLSPFIRRTDLHAMPFYGLGPSSPNSKTEYREQRTEAGAVLSVPIVSWMIAGAGLSALVPTIDHASQPNFVNTDAFLRFHTPTAPSQTRHREEARVTYDWFADQSTGANSFRRLQVFGLESFEVRGSVPDGTVFDRTAWQNFLCDPIGGDECRAGNFVLDALVTTAYADGGHTIPFYLQDTLGGTDRDGFDTLRGLADYRLRAPNRILLQAEFYKDVTPWFGVFVFADTGTVALRASDFGSVRWYHDYGPGIFVRAGGQIALRLYVAFGGGEGVVGSFKFAGGP